MSLEAYKDTFLEIDKYGLLTSEDRDYLVKRGILKPRGMGSTGISCPNCSHNLSEEVLKKVLDIFLEAVEEDKDRYIRILTSKGLNNHPRDHDSMMFR